jgi:hypothetical protein
MASKRVINALVKLAKKRPVRKGLPLINQMIEDEASDDAIAAIRVAGEWMTDDELGVFASLVIAEGGFVACNCNKAGTSTHDEFLASYGIGDDDGGWDYGTTGMSADDAIVHVTKTNHSWGEWIGGVVGNFAAWDDAFKARLRPVLIEAIKWAEANGVDH